MKKCVLKPFVGYISIYFIIDEQFKPALLGTRNSNNLITPYLSPLNCVSRTIDVVTFFLVLSREWTHADRCYNCYIDKPSIKTLRENWISFMVGPSAEFRRKQLKQCAKQQFIAGTIAAIYRFSMRNSKIWVHWLAKLIWQAFFNP